MTDYFSETLRIITDSLKSVDSKVFDNLSNDCILTLNSDRKIVVTGLGKNVPACEKFVSTLWSLGLNAAFLHTSDATHGDLGIIRDGDLVIMLSKSGNTFESIYLMNHLEKRNIRLWVITFNADSSLAKNTSNSLLLKIENEGDLWNLVPNNSATVYFILLQTLTMHICEAIDVKLEVFKKNHPGGSIGVQLNASQ